MEFIGLIFATIFINNILLAQYLGNCPFIGVSKRMDTAVGMSAAVIFILVLAASICWVLQYTVLVPLKLEYLQTIVFILVISSLVQFVELFLKKFSPPLYRSLGIFLPLITTNCAVLGTAVLVIRNEYGFGKGFIFSAAAAVGFALALILFAGLRERMKVSPAPVSLEGTAISLIMAGLMSLAFIGFKGMVF